MLEMKFNFVGRGAYSCSKVPELGFAEHYDDVACMTGGVAVRTRAHKNLTS